MQTKKCSKCGVEQGLFNFHKDSSSHDKRQRICKDCTRERYLSDKQTWIDRAALWQKRNIKQARESYKKYQHSNLAKFNERNAARYALKSQATPVWVERDDLVDFYTAAQLFRLYTGSEYHVDHIVPLNSDVVCGLHCEANLQVLPASDNLSKGNRHWPDMW